MELTPIIIPGKCYRDYTKAALAARKALNRRPGRPFKARLESDVTQVVERTAGAAEKSKKRSLKHLKSKRKMSDLEKLPTELLENVFLHCLNLDLPRSSPVLAGKLSSRLMYQRTILAAFQPSWEMWHGKERNRRVQKDISGGDPDLQSAILRCRWATLELILRTKDVWIQKSAQDRELNPLYFMRESKPFDNDLSESGIPREIPKTAEEYFQVDFSGFLSFAAELDGPSIWHTCNWERNTDVSDGVEIPSTLLLGPWTDDMVKYLFWLIKSGASIDWINSTNGEAALVGLRTAIQVGDTRAVHLLHWAGLIEKLDTDTLVWAIQNAGGNKQSVINHILRLGFSILSDPDARKLGQALSQLRDEAEQRSDQGSFDFVRAVRMSQTLRDVTNLHV